MVTTRRKLPEYYGKLRARLRRRKDRLTESEQRAWEVLDSARLLAKHNEVVSAASERLLRTVWERAA